MPTFRAEPLTPQCDGWCEFPVSDRPNAVAQFFKAAENNPSMIKVSKHEAWRGFKLRYTMKCEEERLA